jgi:hypothetical protein
MRHAVVWSDSEHPGDGGRNPPVETCDMQTDHSAAFLGGIFRRTLGDSPSPKSESRGTEESDRPHSSFFGFNWYPKTAVLEPQSIDDTSITRTRTHFIQFAPMVSSPRAFNCIAGNVYEKGGIHVGCYTTIDSFICCGSARSGSTGVSPGCPLSASASCRQFQRPRRLAAVQVGHVWWCAMP